MNRFSRWCSFLLWPALAVFASTALADDNVAVTKITLRAGARDISAEVFAPRAAAAAPAIVVLHGAGGMLFDGPEMRRVARYLAEAGNAVYVVHYFEATGTLFARDAVMQKHFGTWLQTVRDSIVAVQNLRGNAEPVGIYGYSLGAFLALAAASDNPHVAAVVEQAGGVWNGDMGRLHHMPPVLMIHGRSDARVPFAKYAEPLLPVLRSRAASLETRFFPEEQHVFTQSAMEQVKPATARFFAKHLKRPAPQRSSPGRTAR